MAKIIATLNDEALETWRSINQFIWLVENTYFDDEQTPTWSIAERGNFYNARLNFIARCIQEFDIDETKPFKISEATGSIFYEDGDGTEEPDEPSKETDKQVVRD